MEETLISFETAKLASEKGFDLITEVGNFEYEDENSIYLAARQSLLQKWLREEHNINVSSWCNGSGWAWEIEKTNGTHICIMDIDGGIEGTQPESGMFRTYEQALEDGLLTALKII